MHTHVSGTAHRHYTASAITPIAIIPQQQQRPSPLYAALSSACRHYSSPRTRGSPLFLRVAAPPLHVAARPA
eukprot:429861-Rhodomonas_salina.1